MNELVIMHDQQAVTTSLKVAEVFGKNHKDVMRNIKNLTTQNCAVKKMSPILGRCFYKEI